MAEAARIERRNLIASKVGVLHRRSGAGKLEPWRIEKAAKASLKRLEVETTNLDEAVAYRKGAFP
jgi:aryl-alcohol dehydrogenase-like predicted oxidoreductase